MMKFSYVNSFMQESIRNSADKMLLTAPDSLIVSLATNNSDEGASTSKKGRAVGFGIDALDMLNFTYKVCTNEKKLCLFSCCVFMYFCNGRCLGLWI